MPDKYDRQYSKVNSKVRENDKVVADLMTSLTGERPDDAPSVEAEVSASIRDPFDRMLMNLDNLEELKPECRVCVYTIYGSPRVYVAYSVQAGIYGERVCRDRDYAESVVKESIATTVRNAVGNADYVTDASTVASKYVDSRVVGNVLIECSKAPGDVVKGVKEKLSHQHGGCFRVRSSSQRTGKMLVEDAYMAPRGWFAGCVYV